MNYRDIVAVTGLPGLYQLLANKGDGAIVRDLSGGASKFLPARLHRVTPLETIEVYTTGPNVRLHKVFEAMLTNHSEQLPDAKSDSATLRNYFDTVFPDYDGSRVYDSDLKKMVRWFGILRDADLLKFEEQNAEDAENGEESNKDGLGSTTDMPIEGAAQLEEEQKGNQVGDTGLVQEGDAGKKPRAKKAASKENGPHVETTSTADAEGAASAKKSRAKKAASTEGEEGEEKPAKKTARKKKDDGEAE